MPKNNIPAALTFEDSDLRDFQRAFQEYAKAQKEEMQRTKEILNSLDTLSDLDSLVSDTLEKAIRASAKTLSTIVGT